MREGVGLIETTNFAKYEFTGPGARDFLARILTNRLPAAGRIALSPMLNEDGRLIGDFTVAALPGDSRSEGSERLMVFGRCSRGIPPAVVRRSPADGWKRPLPGAGPEPHRTLDRWPAVS